jgi:tyrosine-protein kinase Etk/Wzc
MQERVSLAELAYVMMRNRRVILAATACAFLVSILISLILPKWYRARSTILPPESMTTQTDVVGIMKYAGFKPAMLPTLTSPSDVYTAILRSDRVLNAVVDSLDLGEVYNIGSRSRLIDRVTRKLHVGVTREGLIEVVYDDRDRERSARVANAFVNELDRFNRETNVTGARRVRVFVENRIVEAEQELSGAENRLKEFKESTGAVFISEQAEASIQTAADIFGRIAELEVSMERLRQFATDRSPEIVDIKTQIRVLERKLAEMGYMGSASEDTATSTLFPRFSRAPELERRLAELMREVEIKRAVYRVLSEQYEEAKIQEMRDTPTLKVLDQARPPLVRLKPKRKMIVGVSTVFAFLLSSFVVFYRERVRAGGRPDLRGGPGGMGDMLRRDWRELKGFFKPEQAVRKKPGKGPE